MTQTKGKEAMDKFVVQYPELIRRRIFVEGWPLYGGREEQLNEAIIRRWKDRYAIIRISEPGRRSLPTEDWFLSFGETRRDAGAVYVNIVPLGNTLLVTEVEALPIKDETERRPQWASR